MLAGHYATALLAKRQVPHGHLAYYLVASQLPDLLWHAFHFLGLEPTQPDNLMAVSLDSMHAQMTYSHDLLPMLGWIALTILVGRAAFGRWRPGWMGGALVVGHALADYVAGYPHNVFGPDTHELGTGLYYTAPYLAVAVEAVFTAAVMAWVVRVDHEAAIRHRRATLVTWAMVFGGGVAFMFFSADLSLAEVLDREPSAAMSGMAIPAMVITYLTMIAALVWADAPTRSRPSAAVPDAR